ncbi:P30 dbc protein [Clonorchis sinensis]|uniref:p30 dbc protein n=1 Tax=Clonorchis sinensis TaxID=79923 RepID=G7Y3S1_CLOSI|nr:P30 dbc protein [Clonorchis sinensis]
MNSLNPLDADYSYSVRVVPIACPQLTEVYKNAHHVADNVSGTDEVPLGKNTHFLVANCAKSETWDIGGPWSLSINGISASQKQHISEWLDILNWTQHTRGYPGQGGCNSRSTWIGWMFDIHLSLFDHGYRLSEWSHSLETSRAETNVHPRCSLLRTSPTNGNDWMTFHMDPCLFSFNQSDRKRKDTRIRIRTFDLLKPRKEEVASSNQKMSVYYYRKHGEKWRHFDIGQSVLVKDYHGDRASWRQGNITRRFGNVMYDVNRLNTLLLKILQEHLDMSGERTADTQVEEALVCQQSRKTIRIRTDRFKLIGDRRLILLNFKGEASVFLAARRTGVMFDVYTRNYFPAATRDIHWPSSDGNNCS